MESVLRVVSGRNAPGAAVQFDPDLIRRYDCQGPRYTSYPTAVQFHEGCTGADFERHVAASNEDPCPAPLSLYVHVPFCATVCYYCACTKVVTRNRAHAATYLERLYREIERKAALFDPDRVVEQLHWGGGTPTFLSPAQMAELMQVTRRHFELAGPAGEYSIEIDPRTVDAAALAGLREIGFNRVSLGVQDFDERVQAAVNRHQSEACTREVVAAARRYGFRSVSVDLIYGLPFQSVSSFGTTLEKLVDLAPDRVSVFNYAHLPHLFKVQQQIAEETLPSAEEKLAILGLTVERLSAAGYVYIGMDHFARPGDELEVAQRNGTLTRNFQGYSTRSGCDLVGLGMSAISQIGDCYVQNERTLGDYQAAIDAGGTAIARGVELSEDDRIRGDVIRQLSCRGRVALRAVEETYRIRFGSYFGRELERLEQMERDGLVCVRDDAIEVLAPGRLLLRNVCMVFDAYLRAGTAKGTFSRAI
ncbi:MAG: oxygen-independent coproporphyrinogen III oxidase [Gammaproteobacteria bacterium]|nr:oxygen-independent coproporphyrinogen III oxidase [Gammaproteobacteria bacterium]